MILPARWTPLKYHETQQRFLKSTARFNIVPAGRRSGKTEIGKRRGLKKALRATIPQWRSVWAAPTHGQAVQIFWPDLKLLADPQFIVSVSESQHTIRFFNGATITVMGLDVPERIEGPPLDHILLDEYGNTKKHAWPRHIRPALSTLGRFGTADFTGVPEGRNHYYDLYEFARSAESGDDWAAFHWKSKEILPESEIREARRDMDELSFRQEYEADFVSFAGRAYYTFDERIHVTAEQLPYDPMEDLVFCFDFNVSPGVAVIAQEHEYSGRNGNFNSEITCVLDEVWIEKNSNTPAVCRELIKKWGKHPGRVVCYGDATGGAKGTAKVDGSDWDIIRKVLRSHFGDRVVLKVPNANPRVRVRVNSVNTRLATADHIYSCLISNKCRHLIKDLEGVESDEAGDINKKNAGELTHISDAFGYYIAEKHPISSNVVQSEPLRL